MLAAVVWGAACGGCGSGSTEPGSGSDNRLPPDDVRAGMKLRAERNGEGWVLNGDKVFVDASPELIAAEALLPSGQFVTISEITASLLADVEHDRARLDPISRDQPWFANRNSQYFRTLNVRA